MADDATVVRIDDAEVIGDVNRVTNLFAHASDAAAALRKDEARELVLHRPPDQFGADLTPVVVDQVLELVGGAASARMSALRVHAAFGDFMPVVTANAAGAVADGADLVSGDVAVMVAGAPRRVRLCEPAFADVVGLASRASLDGTEVVLAAKPVWWDMATLLGADFTETLAHRLAVEDLEGLLWREHGVRLYNLGAGAASGLATRVAALPSTSEPAGERGAASDIAPARAPDLPDRSAAAAARDAALAMIARNEKLGVLAAREDADEAADVVLLSLNVAARALERSTAAALASTVPPRRAAYESPVAASATRTDAGEVELEEPRADAEPTGAAAGDPDADEDPALADGDGDASASSKLTLSASVAVEAARAVADATGLRLDERSVAECAKRAIDDTVAGFPGFAASVADAAREYAARGKSEVHANMIAREFTLRKALAASSRELVEACAYHAMVAALAAARASGVLPLTKLNEAHADRFKVSDAWTARPGAASIVNYVAHAVTAEVTSFRGSAVVWGDPGAVASRMAARAKRDRVRADPAIAVAPTDTVPGSHVRALGALGLVRRRVPAPATYVSSGAARRVKPALLEVDRVAGVRPRERLGGSAAADADDDPASGADQLAARVAAPLLNALVFSEKPPMWASRVLMRAGKATQSAVDRARERARGTRIASPGADADDGGGLVAPASNLARYLADMRAVMDGVDTVLDEIASIVRPESTCREVAPDAGDTAAERIADGDGAEDEGEDLFDAERLEDN